MKAITILKWITSVVSIGCFGLVSYIVLAHLVGNENATHVSLSAKEIKLAIAMSLLFLGSVVAFWKRTIGGVLSILAYIAFVLIQGKFETGVFFLAFLAIGIANLVLGYFNKNEKSSR